MVNMPQRLYHAAPQCAEAAILSEGLRSPSGLVFASSSTDDCLSIMCSRLMAHVHGTKRVDLGPQVVVFPDVVQHEYVPVFEIDVTKTAASKWSVSTEHSALFFGGSKAWAYDGEIAPEALTLAGKFAPQEVLETEGSVSAS